MNTDTPTTDENVNTNSKKSNALARTFKLSLILLLVVALVAGAFYGGQYFSGEDNKSVNKTDNQSVKDEWQKLASNHKGFPIPNADENDEAGTLKYYSLQKIS